MSLLGRVRCRCSHGPSYGGLPAGHRTEQPGPGTVAAARARARVKPVAEAVIQELRLAGVPPSAAVVGTYVACRARDARMMYTAELSHGRA